MFLLHYIIPLLIYVFYKNKSMVFGLLLANLIDLDHVIFRLIGKVPWFQSACTEFGKQCSLGFYPFHNIWVILVAIILCFFLLSKNKYLKFIGWLGMGIILHLFLDVVHYWIGFGI